MSIEDMFDELKKEKDKIKPEDDVVLGAMTSSYADISTDVFISIDGVIYADPNTLNELEKIYNEQYK